MEWRVGVLRAGAETIAWIDGGDELDWLAARSAAVRSLKQLADREGRHEYRIEVGDVEGIVTPGVDEYGSIQLDGLGESLPRERG